MRKYAPDLAIVLLLLLLPLILFSAVTLGDRTLLPADNLVQWEPFATYREVVQAPEVPHNSLLSDLVLENYVWRGFVRESITNGELPLWNPHLFAGVPFFAAGQASVIYPLSLLYYVLPLASAYGWYTVIQLWLAGLCMYLFARGIGQGRIGGTVAAVSWELAAWFVIQAVFPMILGASAWLPLLLLMVEFVIRARPILGRPATLPWVALGAIGLALVILAGHVEITYYTLLIMVFYAAARLGMVAWAGRRERATFGRLIRRGVWLLAMVGCGIGLGAVQLLPLFELVSRNFREGSATLDQIRSWAYPARRIIAFFMPNFFGNPSHHAYVDVFSGQTVQATLNALGQPITTIDWGIKNYVEGGAYMGLLPMILAAYGLVAAWGSGLRRIGTTAMLASPRSSLQPSPSPRVERGPGGEVAPYRGLFATLALVSLTFIFGTPTYAILYYLLPGINQLHSPFRWVFALTLSVAVLAGFGAEALQTVWRRTANPDAAGDGEAEGTSPSPRVERGSVGASQRRGEVAAVWATRLLIALGVLVLLGLGLSRVFYAQIEPLIDRLLHSLALAENAFADARMFYSYQFTNVLTLGLILLGAGIVFWLARRKWQVRGVPLWAAAAVALIAADLMVASWGFNPAADPALLDFTPPALEWLQGQDAEARAAGEGPVRITTYDAPGEALLNANIPWMFGLQDARGYDSIIPKQYTDFMALISPQFQLEYNRVAPLTTDQPQALDSPLLDVLGVRYVVTTQTIEREGWTLAYEDEALRVYANTDVLPRAYTLPLSTELVYGSPEEFAALVQDIDPRTVTLVYRPLTSQDIATRPAEPVAQTITEYRGLQVTVDATIAEPSWLVLADSYFTGWRAYVRPAGTGEDAEHEVPIALVDGNFRGVLLDPAALAERYAEQVAAGEVTLSDTWSVRFRYSPPSFQVGAFLTFIAGAALVFALGVWLWRGMTGGQPAGEGEGSGMRRLAKNSLMPILMNLFNKGIDFAFAFIMLRVLGPEGAGIYYYAIVVFGWFDILTNFGLNTYLTREVARDRTLAGRSLVNTSLLRLELAGVGVPLLAIFLLVRQTAVADPLDVTAIAAIVLLYVGLLPNSLSTGLSALFYAFERAEIPAAIATVGTLSKATLGLGALLLGWGVIGLAGVSIITNLIILAVMLWAARPLLRGARPAGGAARARPDGGHLRRMLVDSWPLMINHLLATVFYKIVVILMEAINGVRVVGWYSTAYKWLDALQVIPAFLSAALLPVLSRQAHDDPARMVRSYRLAVKLLVLVALPVAVLTTFLAPTLILLLGGSEYLPDGAIALQIMIWSIPIGWINSITQYALIALDQQRVLTRAFLIVVIFNVGANLICLPRFGYPAAAVITILGEGLLLTIFLRLLHATLQARLESGSSESRVGFWGLVWRPGLAAGLMFGAVAGLWQAAGGLAVGVGIALYPLALFFLRPFDPAERAELAPLLPGPLRARMPLQPDAGRGQDAREQAR